ncbi:MAG TPA: GNAT family N-acetyltransferase [bacterium]|nr:GNAT family N-acetyltransferase [bacterium]
MSNQTIFEGITRDGGKWEVRSYRPEDRERVRWICSETGFIGNPQEAVFIGRDEFADLWSSYWTDYEPESAFVATVEGRVEGYMLGCLDTRRQEKIWNKMILPRVVRRLIRPAWWRHSINRRFIRAMVRSRLRHEFSAPLNDIIAAYPAHLHTNIGDPAMRGLGLGGHMTRALFDYLRQKGVRGVHLGTTSHNRQAVPFYEHVGFKVIHKSLFTAYDQAITDPPLYLLYMGKQL